MDNTQPPPATTITATPTPIRLPPHQRHDQQHQQQHSLHGDGDASTNISTTATITTSSAADLSSSELTLAKFVPMETPPQPPPAASSEATRLRPAPGSQEWEAHKSMINDLYMGRNLNLNEVVEQMRLSCDFIATPRMYKAQFAKWGWSKYNCKRMRRDVSSGKPVVRSQGKSCYRVKKHRGAVTTAAEKERQDSQDSGTSARVGPSGSSSAQQTQDSGAVVEVGPRGTSSSSSSSAAAVVLAVTATHQPASALQLAPSSFRPSTATMPPPTQPSSAAAATTQLARRPISSSSSSSASLPQHILHVNDTTRFIQSILTDIRSHVYEIFSRKPDWHQSRASKIGLINAYEYTSYDHFVIAMDAFLKNEHHNGGEILRQAFLEVEEAILTDYSSTFYFFFIDLPDLFLHYGRHDILTILLGHIKRLTGAITLRERISGTGFASLHALAETDPGVLRHYISTASGLWCDLLSELRGSRDRSTLLAQRNYLRHNRSADHRFRVGRLCGDYVVLLRDVHQQFGPGHDMSRHMEDVILSTQMVHDFFVDGFVRQNETLVASLEDKYRIGSPAASSALESLVLAGGSRSRSSGSSSSDGDEPGYHPAAPVGVLAPQGWDVLDRSIRSNCYHRLSYYYSHHGDADRANDYSAKASEGWRDTFWHLEAEAQLVAAGRHFEAQSLRRCRLEAQYFHKLPENDEMIFGGWRGMAGSRAGGGSWSGTRRTSDGTRG